MSGMQGIQPIIQEPKCLSFRQLIKPISQWMSKHDWIDRNLGWVKSDRFCAKSIHFLFCFKRYFVNNIMLKTRGWGILISRLINLLSLIVQKLDIEQRAWTTTELLVISKQHVSFLQEEWMRNNYGVWQTLYKLKFGSSWWGVFLSKPNKETNRTAVVTDILLLALCFPCTECSSLFFTMTCNPIKQFATVMPAAFGK